MSPWRQQPLESLTLPSGVPLEVEIRGIPARAKEFWLLVHGLGGSRRTPLVRLLLRRLREAAAVVAVPDLPGGGGGVQDPATLAAGLEALDAVVDRFGSLCARIHLLGFSLGGVLAAAWAARNPGRAAAAVLVAPAFSLAGEGHLAGWEAAGAAQVLGALDLPVLLLHGRQDTVVPAAETAALLKVAGPQAELCLLPGADHLFAGREEALFARIRAFWRAR